MYANVHVHVDILVHVHVDVYVHVRVHAMYTCIHRVHEHTVN